MAFTSAKKSAMTAMNTISGILSNKFFPAVTAIVVLTCYYLGWDVVTIYYVAIVGVLMLLTLKDLTPLIPHFLFMNIMVSYQNSPMGFGDAAGSDYYSRTANLVQIGILIGVFVLAIFIRSFYLIKTKTFRPEAVFWGLCLLSVAFLLNGVGSENYKLNDLVYGVFMVFFFLVIYVLMAGNVSLTKENFDKIAWGFVIFSAALVFELIVKYATDYDKIVVNGIIEKQAFVMGWGVWNNFGTFFCICIPPVCILASKSKYGYVYLTYAAVLMVCAFLTGSRQAMLGSCFAFAVSGIGVIVKSKTRIANAVILSAILIAVIVILSLKWDSFIKLCKELFDDVFDEEGSYVGNGRMRLLRLAVEYFEANPAFGSGFFSDFESFTLEGMTGSIIPTFAHNTFAELLAAGGIVGIFSYLVHRTTTVVKFFKKPSIDKYFVAMSILTLLLVCMLDNYIFYMLPTLVYSSTLPFATGTPKNDEKSAS